MNGDDIRAARELRGLSRAQLAPLLDITPAQLGRIESKGPRADEEYLFVELLERAGIRSADAAETSSTDTAGLPPAPTDEEAGEDPDGRTIRVAWQGLSRGQICRLDSANGPKVKFGHYFQSPAQEFVSVFSLKNGGEKCVRPARVWRWTERGVWRPALEA